MFGGSRLGEFCSSDLELLADECSECFHAYASMYLYVFIIVYVLFLFIFVYLYCANLPLL